MVEIREQTLKEERVFAVSAFQGEAGAVLEADGVWDLAFQRTDIFDSLSAGPG